MKHKRSNNIVIIIILAILFIGFIIPQYRSPSRSATPAASDFRNFYGIGWIGSACDNLGYAKSMGYDYVYYQTGMEKCSPDIKRNMKFYIGDPEFDLAIDKYIWALNYSKTYTTEQRIKYENFFAWKANETTTGISFPRNIATGWFFSLTSFRANPDFQQQKVIDETAAYAVAQIAPLENKSIGWEFGGYAWDVPDLVGDWWTGRQGTSGHTECTASPGLCTGRIVNLSWWHPQKIESSGLHGNITHEYSKYSEGRAAVLKKIFSETRKTHPNMKIYYQPYNLYSWIRIVEQRSDKLELMPPNQVFLCQESADSWTNDIQFLTDSRIYASGLITIEYTCSDNPDNHDHDRNLALAGTAAINGAWHSWYGRTGATDGTTNYPITTLPDRLKMVRVIANWENKNQVPLADRHWTNATKTYTSPNAYADLNVMYSHHPYNGDLYAVILNANGKITLRENEQVKEIYNVNNIFLRSARAEADFNIVGRELTLKSSTNYGKGYIIVTETSTTPTAQDYLGYIFRNNNCTQKTITATTPPYNSTFLQNRTACEALIQPTVYTGWLFYNNTCIEKSVSVKTSPYNTTYWANKLACQALIIPVTPVGKVSCYYCENSQIKITERDNSCDNTTYFNTPPTNCISSGGGGSGGGGSGGGGSGGTSNITNTTNTSREPTITTDTKDNTIYLLAGVAFILFAIASKRKRR